MPAFAGTTSEQLTPPLHVPSARKSRKRGQLRRASGPAGAGQRLLVAAEGRLGVDISLLAFDAPVFQPVDRDGEAADRAAHEGAGRNHLEVAVEVADAGLAARTRHV